MNSFSVLLKGNDEGVERVYKQPKDAPKPYAFFMESKSIEYNVERKCNITKLGDELDDKNYGIGMRKGKSLRLKLRKWKRKAPIDTNCGK